MRRHRTTAADLRNDLEDEIARGRIQVQLVVGSNGHLRIFLGMGRLPRMWTRELVDMCPHCFIEEQVALRLPYQETDLVVDGYRHCLARDQATQVQMHRPPVRLPGASEWVVDFHHPGSRWKVAYSQGCLAHHLGALWRTQGIEGTDPDPVLAGGLRAEVNGVVELCRFRGVPDDLLNDETIATCVYPAFVDVFGGTPIERRKLTLGVDVDDHGRATVEDLAPSGRIVEHAEWFGGGLPRRGRVYEWMVAMRDEHGPMFVRKPSHLFGTMLAADVRTGVAWFREPHVPFLATNGTEVKLADAGGAVLWRAPLDRPARRSVDLTPTFPSIAATVDHLVERFERGDADESVDHRFVTEETVLWAFASAYVRFSLDAIDQDGQLRAARSIPTVGPIDATITEPTRTIPSTDVDLHLCSRSPRDIRDETWTEIRAHLAPEGVLCIAVPDPTIEEAETLAPLERAGFSTERSVVERLTDHTVIVLPQAPP